MHWLRISHGKAVPGHWELASPVLSFRTNNTQLCYLHYSAYEILQRALIVPQYHYPLQKHNGRTQCRVSQLLFGLYCFLFTVKAMKSAKVKLIQGILRVPALLMKFKGNCCWKILEVGRRKEDFFMFYPLE